MVFLFFTSAHPLKWQPLRKLRNTILLRRPDTITQHINFSRRSHLPKPVIEALPGVRTFLIEVAHLHSLIKAWCMFSSLSIVAVFIIIFLTAAFEVVLGFIYYVVCEDFSRFVTDF